MAAHFDASIIKKRQREESGCEETTKRQHSSEEKVLRPLRQDARLKAFPREHDLLGTKKNSSFTPQRQQSYEDVNLFASTPDYLTSKTLQPVVGTPVDQDPRLNCNKAPVDPVYYWVKENTWPKEHFEPNEMSHLLARQRSTASLRRKRSDSGSRAASSITPSDQKPRGEKSAPYRDARYETLLATKNSFMARYKLGLTDASKALCQTLLENHQIVPKDSAFRDDLFEETCEMIRNKNEARVIRDISLLIVPSAEFLAARGAETFKVLVEGVNEGWNNSISLTGTRPQPDYSVGFKREAFSEEQREKLAPFIGNFVADDQSYFMATYYMYFPFFTCEVKCGAAALDIADRQNAHNLTLAVRGVVELFKLVKREKEIDREILAFSISHDHRSVRIYGHYAIIDGRNTSFYRHPIHTFDFTALDGHEKWTAYKVTKNIYDIWMPTHFKRLCSAIEDLPLGVNLDVPPLQQDSGLSRDLESYHVSESFHGSAVRTEDEDSQSGTRITTPDTSFAQQGASKRQRAKRAKRTK